MIEELISRVFHARNLAHFEHWRASGAGSYAKHQALGSFYEDIISALDTLVETYQGAFGLVGDVPETDADANTSLKLLDDTVKWIEENHEKICDGNRAVANKIDEVTAIMLTTIYKLRNLK
jgi:DNA-binding ferritin-like protein